MWIINYRLFPKPETQFFLRSLFRECAEVEGVDRDGACLGFLKKSGGGDVPVMCPIGSIGEGTEKHLQGYIRMKTRFLRRNTQFLTSFEMEPIDFNGEKVVLGGGLSFPNFIVAGAGTRFEINEVLAYLFGCYLENLHRGGTGYVWLRGDVENNFSIFSDCRMAESVMGRGVLQKVLPRVRKALGV
ncbi:MAG TPA: hypothetical protein VN420_05510 [Candidatus Fimivivens sp.]|nr:hypothetical protein [Candidatus Fimivivens sp.]